MKVAALLLALAVAACGQAHPDHGTVIAKWDTPAFTTFIPIPMSCGKNCNTVILIPQYNPPTWVVRLQNCERVNDKGDRVCDAWDQHLPVEQWSRTSLDDVLTYPKETSSQ